MMLRPLPYAAAIVALATMGCSDAPARPAKLGLYMMIRNPNSSLPELVGKSCPSMSGVEWDIGKAIKSGSMVINVDSPTPTDFGTTLEDGKSGVNLACTVRKNGSFSAEGGGTDPMIIRPDGLINFQISGTAKKSAPTALNLSVYTPRTRNVRTNPGFPGCTMTAVHEQAPGAIWADFDCPALTKIGDPNVACQANGTIVMEYCKTGEEDE